MFGLSLREVLERNIKNACVNNKHVYKELVINFLDQYSADLDNIPEDAFLASRIGYFNAVFDTIVDSLRASSPETIARVHLAALSPRVCGYEGMDMSTGISAGMTFALCYWALTGKEAPVRTCQFLSHYQNAMMTEVLVELSEQYK